MSYDGRYDALMVEWAADPDPVKRNHAALWYRLAEGADREEPPAGTTAQPEPGPPRCPFLDSCLCHPTGPVCLHQERREVYGRPADEAGQVVYAVGPDDCRKCPLNP